MKKNYCVKPSVSSVFFKYRKDLNTLKRRENIPKGFRILLLSGYHVNKNIELLPKILSYLKEIKGINDVIFVLTLPPKHKGTEKVLKLAKNLGVNRQLFNFQP